MRRGLVLLLLLSGMLWQMLTMAGQMVVFAHGEDLEHALKHWHERAHHHEEGGTFRTEHSNEAIQHVAIDGAQQAPALLPSLLLPVISAGSAVLVGLQQRSHPPPFLEGPTRPPRIVV